MNAFELGRYLDYCNEMLSLIGKLAAVYIQRFDDEVALEAVTEVEILTASLCDRIWQKIMFLNSIEGQMRTKNDLREGAKQATAIPSTEKVPTKNSSGDPSITNASEMPQADPKEG